MDMVAYSVTTPQHMMSNRFNDPVFDEQRASEKLEELLTNYNIAAPAHLLRELFQHRWDTLSRLAHALHNAQLRRRPITATEYEDESTSG